MTTMLDKCAVAGDITQGIDRRGVWTAAITVIGGTSGTAVKLVSSDTVNGEYTDYKTLISAADAETDQYKGFVVDLHGAKKFIKVTGTVMATAVFGDCDHDVKAIAITEGEVPSGADLENNKEVEITENGEIEITPSAGKDGMKKVTATVNVSGGGGGSATAYAWHLTYEDKAHPGQLDGGYRYCEFSTPPENLSGFNDSHVVMIDDSELNVVKIGDSVFLTALNYEVVDGVIVYETDSAYNQLTRDATKDFTLWS